MLNYVKPDVQPTNQFPVAFYVINSIKQLLLVTTYHVACSMLVQCAVNMQF